MPSAADRLEFGPPPAKASLRALGLALLVHTLLIIALTWGVHWKRSDKAASFEAELWSSMPQEAAPRLVEAPPPPPPPPTPTPEVKVTPPAPKVDIALEQEKKRKLLQQQKEAEAQQLQDRLKAELQAKKEKELKAKEELARRKAAEEAKKAETKDAEKQKQADALAKKQREENLKRMLGQAGATGGADAKGSAQKSSGPSASYGAKVAAKIELNVVFTDDIADNPRAEVEVRTTPDGTIISQRLVKSSGNKAWDDAVIKAIIRTGTLPRDVDGRVPTPMVVELRPKKN